MTTKSSVNPTIFLYLFYTYLPCYYTYVLPYLEFYSVFQVNTFFFQITLEQALALCQKYHSRMQAACEWLEDAVGFLQQASLGVDVENYEECLRQQEDIMATEQDFLSVLQELEALPPLLENLVNHTAKEQLRLSVESAQQRGVEVRDQLQCHQDVLNRYNTLNLKKCFLPDWLISISGPNNFSLMSSTCFMWEYKYMYWAR